MFEIRYYKKVFHPDDFIGKGWRGFFVRVLNWCRWKLEVLVHRLVLGVLLKEDAAPKEARKEVMQQFDQDVENNRILKETSSPLNKQPLSERSERYAPTMEGEEMATVGPKSLHDLVSRYGHETRSKRYARKSRFFTKESFEEIGG